MYRARKVAATMVGCPLRLTHLRQYTPIAAPDSAVDHIAVIRHADELQTLWSRDIPVGTVGRAVEVWLRLGNDPVVHTSLPTTTAVSEKKTSPFSCVEDYMGTNLVAERPAHVKDSAELWMSYFEAKYLGRMRQSRRTSANFIGILNATAALTDEADHPNTKWSADTQFSEVAYLSERHLKEKVSNPMQLEQALWLKADVDAFLAFHQSYTQQTSTRIPLPVPSLWVHEGEARKLWANKYLHALRAARAFFDNVLAADVKAGSPARVCKAVAEAFEKVNAILLKRRERQVKAGLVPSSWVTAPAEQRAAWVANEVEAYQRSIQEDNFDPEDLLDSAPEWTTEHAEIGAILEATVDGMNLTLKDFWTHTIRLEELETEHVLESEKMREVAAAARAALYAEQPYAQVLQALADSVARGALDLRAGVFQPHPNTTWCKLYYAKFGASSIYQHTTTASRQLLFHYAASSLEIAATATLYYATKPLSSKLDYASPYTLRRSYAQLCAAYGLDMTHAAHRPLFLSAHNIAQAEESIRRVVDNVARPYGDRRRSRLQAAQVANRYLLPPVNNVVVSKVDSELLSTGADDAAITSQPEVSGGQVAMWPLGSKAAVVFQWSTSHLEKLTVMRQAGSLTASRAASLLAIQQQGKVEISLWRKRAASELAAARTADVADDKAVAELIAAHPQLKQVSRYASRFFSRLSREGTTQEAALATNESDGSDWEFAVMLNDRFTLREDLTYEVYLPYTDAQGHALPQGEYRVCVRAYDLEANPSAHPSFCAEAFSAVFPVFDALPQLVDQFFEKKGSAALREDVNKGPTTLVGSDLIAFCEFLRAAGLDVPLHFEFDVGQRLDPKGDIELAAFLDSLRSPEFHQSLADSGYSDAQRAMETKCRAHWQLYHPGADAGEWAAARRTVLNGAMAKERDWWMPDPLLDVADVATAYLPAESYPAIVRYGTELCTVLSADGSTHEDCDVANAPAVADKRRLRADCTVDGTGAISSLTFGSGTAVSAPDVTTAEALEAALTAIQHAQNRHCTLSMFKLGPMERQAQMMTFCNIHGSEFGGKYGRTYAYAVDKAKKELLEVLTETGRSALGVGDMEKERLSEHKEVDRFASDSHPQQRVTRFVKRVDLSGRSMEDLGPNESTTWNR